MSFQITTQDAVSTLAPPIRILTMVGIFLFALNEQMPWQSATMLFSWFFPLFGASYVVELIMLQKPQKFSDKIKSLATKYQMNLPLEFVGVASMALLSFVKQTEAIHNLELEIILITLTSSIIIEFIHRKVFPRFEGKTLKGRAGVLVIIGLTFILLAFSLYAWFYSNSHVINI